MAKINQPLNTDFDKPNKIKIVTKRNILRTDDKATANNVNTFNYLRHCILLMLSRLSADLLHD